MHSWFGFISHVSCAFATTEQMLKFLESLKPRKSFHWDNQLNQLFEESKSLIINEKEEEVCIFDKSKPI